MRNNSDRLNPQGGDEQFSPPSSSPDDLEALMGANAPSGMSSLSFVSPTEFTRLPSKGKYYENFHPLCGKEEVEIRLMTAKDEDILTNRSYLQRNETIDRLITSLLVNKVDPKTLLVGDRSSIIVQARISAYGPEYETVTRCPNCGEERPQVFDLNQAMNEAFEELEKKNMKVFDTGMAKWSAADRFTLELPKTKWIAEAKIMTGYEDAALTKQQMAQQAKQKTKRKDDFTTEVDERNMSDILRMIIVSLNGERDPQKIARAIREMPASDASFLRQVYYHVAPSLELKAIVTCGDCFRTSEVDIPIRGDFFRVGR
jgi:hypothetical protein